MWAVVKYLAEKLGIRPPIELSLTTLEDEDEFLREIFDPEREDLSLTMRGYKCVKYSGRITKITDFAIIIDREYCFPLDKGAQLPFLVAIGKKVSCQLYTNGIDAVVRNLKEDENLEAELEVPEPEQEESKEETDEYCISGKITMKCLRDITVEPFDNSSPLTFSMDSVRCEFIPIPGDHVFLTFTDRINDLLLNLKSIKPFNADWKDGVVSSWDKTEGSISQFCWFSVHNCEAGYMPTVGDKVIASILMSDCKEYSWRALQVVPHPIDPNYKLSNEMMRSRENMTSDKNGITLTKVVPFEVPLNTKKKFTIVVQNKGNEPMELLEVQQVLYSTKSQIVPVGPSGCPILITPGMSVPFKFEISTQFVGVSTEQFTWVFHGFSIARFVTVRVSDSDLKERPKPQAPFRFRQEITANQLLDRTSGVVMPGRRSFAPASFVPVKLQQYPMPTDVLKAALPENHTRLENLILSVSKVLPVMSLELSPQTYKERMHGLLFIEETALLKQIGELFIKKTTFRKIPDFLILDVPPLSLYTTKLVAGDMLVAKPLNNKGDIGNLKFEGVIHCVKKRELWLQFSTDFHDTFRHGTYFSVSFKTSRATLRRMHQSIDLAVKHLGFDWLFPTRIVPAPFQIQTIESNEPRKRKPCGQIGIVQPGAPKSGPSKPNDLVGNEVIQLKQQLYSSDPRKITANVRHLQVSEKLNTPSANPNNERHSFQKWNRQGTGYGRNCTVDNEVYRGQNLSNSIKTIYWFNPNLNRQQKDAVISVLHGEARPLPYILFGPPGTGKTVTIVEIILQIHTLIPHSRILVVTPSNSAADLITERLVDSGNLSQKQLLRFIGYHYLEHGRINARIKPYSAVPDVKAANAQGISGCSHEGIPMVGRQSLGEHDITVGTLGCTGLLYNMGFVKGHFTHVIIDEAGQASEPEVLIPIGFLQMKQGGQGQIILAGDPLQLGPVITSQIASRLGLQESLLSRLLNRYPYAKDLQRFTETCGYDPRLVTKLVNNYRSLPKILALSSMLFYDNELIPNVMSTGSIEAKIVDAVTKCNPHSPESSSCLVFHGVRGENAQEEDSHSWFNPQEVRQTLFYLNVLYSAGVSPEQVGIITPYQLQSVKIRSAIENLNLEAPKVGSVEEFQGQEKVAIIVSVVRSSQEEVKKDVPKALGFVANRNRLNVALSRARAVLIILGNPHLLNWDPHWRSVLLHCVAENAYVGCDRPLEMKPTVRPTRMKKYKSK